MLTRRSLFGLLAGAAAAVVLPRQTLPEPVVEPLPAWGNANLIDAFDKCYEPLYLDGRDQIGVRHGTWADQDLDSD